MLLPHATVQRAAFQQLVVRAAGDDAAGVHDEDLVGARHGGQAVRDGDERLPDHELADGALDERLVLGIGVGRRLVEARAMAMRCFSPPLSLSPASPARVS